jgi:hypothetical protein
MTRKHMPREFSVEVSSGVPLLVCSRVESALTCFHKNGSAKLAVQCGWNSVVQCVVGAIERYKKRERERDRERERERERECTRKACKKAELPTMKHTCDHIVCLFV